MLIDSFPTILRLAGLPADLPQLHGRNLFAENRDRTPFAYSEYFSVEGGSYASRMILRDGMKLIDTRDDARSEHRKELYDLKADPTEQRDLVRDWTVATDAQLSDLQKSLDALASNTPAGQAPRVDVPGATEEILRNLGYGTTLDRR